MSKHNKKMSSFPYVSVCTPTFNRRPFVSMMIQCFQHQDYPKDKLEWIIIDDGTDKIEELVSHIPQVKYFKYDEKLTLGKKRNISNEKATGEIIIYMDDDDYYPPNRISHAVNRLKTNPKALCAGSSAMYIYFKHIDKMYQFGPYGPNHSTAATFAFKRELLKKTKFNEESSIAEEKFFLKNYTIPFVQLDPEKSILVFAHNQNSFDKKELLQQGQNQFIHELSIKPSDIIKEDDILKFFMEDIDGLLNNYELGKLIHKPDVTTQLQVIKESREKMMKEEMIKQNAILQQQIPQMIQNKLNDQAIIIQQLNIENQQLQDKVKYLEDKIKNIIQERIKEKQMQSNT
jgi:glycosyltransferase involved in cell wall biosynthesis